MVDDAASRRMTLVPGIGVYRAESDNSSIRGKIGVVASNITCSPKPAQGQIALGTWSAADTALELMMDGEGRGPRSGVPADYESRRAATGRHIMLITDSALLGAVDGNSVWGQSGNKKVGQLLVWRWEFGDIASIRVDRLKKMLKWWDGEVVVQSTDPPAKLHFNGYGPDAPSFSSYDKSAKAAKVDGSSALGFAHTLATAVAAARGRQFRHDQSVEGKDSTDTFTFT